MTSHNTRHDITTERYSKLRQSKYRFWHWIGIKYKNYPNWDTILTIGWIETPSKYGLSGLGQQDRCPNHAIWIRT